jgi:hypothetical protein
MLSKQLRCLANERPLPLQYESLPGYLIACKRAMRSAVEG